MEGQNAGSRRVNRDIPAKGDSSDRKSSVLQSDGVEHKASNLVSQKPYR